MNPKIPSKCHIICKISAYQEGNFAHPYQFWISPFYKSLLKSVFTYAWPCFVISVWAFLKTLTNMCTKLDNHEDENVIRL